MAGDRKPWPERTREKIRAGELITRLSMHALGQDDPKTGKPLKMSVTQVKAATVLIDKVLPNLQSVEQVVWDANAGMTESEAKAKLVELANKNPELTQLLAKHFLPPLENKLTEETESYPLVDKCLNNEQSSTKEQETLE